MSVQVHLLILILAIVLFVDDALSQTNDSECDEFNITLIDNSTNTGYTNREQSSLLCCVAAKSCWFGMC